MEGTELNVNPGVEGAEEIGNEGTANPIEGSEVNTGAVDSSNDEGTEEAGQASEGVDNAGGIETSKAFAARLSAKTKQVESQVEEKYKPIMSFIEREAGKYGLKPEEYIAEMEKQEAEEAQEREFEEAKQKYGDGLTPEALEKIKKAESFEEQHKWDNDNAAFRKAFPNVKGEDIPDEVFLARMQNGTPLATAYKAYLFDNQGQQTEKIKIEAEQKALKQLQQNAKSTPGSLGAGAASTEVSFKNMSDTQFSKVLEEFKRTGKIKI